MKKTALSKLFTDYLKKESLFKDKGALQARYTPENIPHREKELKIIAQILAPALKIEKPSNLFMYGKTGTGKTVSIFHVKNELEEIAKDSNIPLKILYVNCKLKKVADTEYRLVAHLARALGKTIPPTGLPTDEVYQIFFKTLDSKNQQLVLVLDEIDQLVKKAGDEILYNLTRINTYLEKALVTLVGISNDLTFADHIDPRIKSSLSEEELVFPPYNALQLQDILRHRAEVAFKKGTIGPGLIEKCAAYAAREHGDARRALELLRVSGEIAERLNSEQVTLLHIDAAEEKIEKDRIHDLLSTQPKQFKAVLFSIVTVCTQQNDSVFTGEIYEHYKKQCQKNKLRPLTQRRVSDIIGEFDMLGLINAKVISKGRYGRTREISIGAESLTEHIGILEEGLR